MSFTATRAIARFIAATGLLLSAVPTEATGGGRATTLFTLQPIRSAAALSRANKANSYLDVNVCFDVYMQQSANASCAFEQTVLECELSANRTLQHLTYDEAATRAEVAAGANAICQHVADCQQLVNDLAFFECITKVAPMNMDILVDMRFNASAAYVQLGQDIDAVQQHFLICTIEAQRQFVDDMRAAYDALLSCRAQVPHYDDDDAAAAAAAAADGDAAAGIVNVAEHIDATFAANVVPTL